MLRKTKPKPISKKREKERQTYKKLFTQMDTEAKAKGEYVCFFCGKPIVGVANHHHLRGRENSMLNEPEYLVLAHNDCHLNYHRMTVDQIKREPWYEEWMVRLKKKDLQSWEKEISKSQKTILFNDED